MAENEKIEAKASEKKPVKKDKPSFIERTKKFWRDYRSELKKVVWASRESTLKNTLIVAIAVVVCGAVIGALDFTFSKLIVELGKLI